jgi:hypothetical protein
MIPYSVPEFEAWMIEQRYGLPPVSVSQQTEFLMMSFATFCHPGLELPPAVWYKYLSHHFSTIRPLLRKTIDALRGSDMGWWLPPSRHGLLEDFHDSAFWFPTFVSPNLDDTHHAPFQWYDSSPMTL